MRLRRGFWVLIVLAAVLFGCSRKAERTLVVEGQVVKLALAAHSETEWTAVGAAHVGGLPFPKGVKYPGVFALRLGDRPSWAVSAYSFEDRPSEAELANKLESIEIAFSPDKKHLSVRFTDTWVVLHLLDRGPPFTLVDPAYDTIWERRAPDLRTMAPPEKMVLAMIQNDKALNGIKELGAWKALEDQEPGSLFEAAVLDVWPLAGPANPLVKKWAARRPQHPSFLPLLQTRVDKHLKESKVDTKAVEEIVDAAEDPVARRTYDQWLADRWPGSDIQVLFRLERGMSDDVRQELLSKASATLREADSGDTDRRQKASQLLLRFGSPDQRKVALDSLLADAPSTYSDFHDVLMQELPKLDAAQRTTLVARISRYLASAAPSDANSVNRILNAIDVLLALNEKVRPAAFAQLLSIWPCRDHRRSDRMIRQLAAATPAHHTAATQRTKIAFQTLFDKAHPPIENKKRLCAAQSEAFYSDETVFEMRVELEKDAVACDELRAARSRCSSCKLPVRCQ